MVRATLIILALALTAPSAQAADTCKKKYRNYGWQERDGRIVTGSVCHDVIGLSDQLDCKRCARHWFNAECKRLEKEQRNYGSKETRAHAARRKKICAVKVP